MSREPGPSLGAAQSAVDVNRYIVRGRVQGVGYRWFTRREARALRIFGFVCNRADGSVEVVAGGGSVPLGEFAVRLAQGPRGARVDSVDVEPVAQDSTPLPRSFEIV